jgi:hypothetical protein
MQTMSPAELLQTLLQRASASGPAVAAQNPSPSLHVSTPPAQAPPWGQPAPLNS